MLHNTAIGMNIGASGGAGVAPSCLAIDRYVGTFSFVNNLIALNPSSYGGLMCQGDGNTEGTKSEIDMADAPTFRFNHNALVGRAASNYTEQPGTTVTDTVTVSGGTTVTGTGKFSTSWPVGLEVQIGNLISPVASITNSTTLTLQSAVANGSGQSFSAYPGINPPSTLWFPPNVVCSGTTADSSCFGFQGMMNGVAYEPAAANYHDYALVPSSLYNAGGSRHGNDGKQVGADISAIDSAITSTIYVCGSSCGTHGPYSD